MRALNIFKKILIILSIGVVLVLTDGIWRTYTYKPSLQMRTLTALSGNPFENSTLYFRHFELSDYMSGHFYYPGAPLLGYESYTYRVKHYEP